MVGHTLRFEAVEEVAAQIGVTSACFEHRNSSLASNDGNQRAFLSSAGHLPAILGNQEIVFV